MNIKLIKLSVQGQNKTTKEVIFNEKNTLIQGSSDTGKSYILSAIYYCLNGSDIPKNVGYSSGYTTFILIFSLNSKKYTIIRDYAFNINNIYCGEFNEINPPKGSFLSKKINDFLILELGLAEYKILTKAGKIGNINLSNLKYFSFFNEDRTLSSDFFISSKETNKVLERKSLFSFLLTGQDDKNLELSTSQEEKHRIDGRISAYNAELQVLEAWYDNNKIDKFLPVDEIHEKILFLDTQLEAKLDIKIVTHDLVKNLNYELSILRNLLNSNQKEIEKINENLTSFKTLNEKYESDKERLVSILNTHLVFEQFIEHNCPLCDAIMKIESTKDSENLIKAIEFEIKKIDILQNELKKIIPELELEHSFYISENLKVNEKININLENQQTAKNEIHIDELLSLTHQKSILEHSISVSERISYINQLIDNNKQTKSKKVKVIRELSVPFNAISIRCKILLKEWGLTNIHNLYISIDEMDLIINQRQRISFGKGKRAIFLTAFAIAIMEYSLDKNIPHLGFTIIDSPLVTHKDPKYGEQKLTEENREIELESYMSETVAQKFYKWLVEYRGQGQIIIIENDAPNEKFKNQVNYIEFTGNSKLGRSGFF